MSFDAIAPYYRLLETIAFNGLLQRARIHWLGQIPRPNRVLIAGEGNGRFICELLRVHPEIHIDCVDSSARMLQLARARVRQFHPQSLPKIQFIHRDILRFSLLQSYDLFVTHFFFDCFTRKQVETIVEKLASAARNGALWLIADFAIPSRGLARIRAKLWLHLMYSFFRSVAVISARELFDPWVPMRNNGFTRTREKVFSYGMIESKVYSRPLAFDSRVR